MTARELVMALFDSAREPVLSVAYLVAAAALFDIDARALRVALTRLVKAGVLISPRRGEYTVGAAGEALHARVRHWERVEDDVVPWSGSWWMVDVAALGRADRAALRRRERALRLRGFSGDTTGTWWRPANLNRDVGTLHEELVSLGLDPDARLLHVAALAPADSLCADALWDRQALETRYLTRREALAASAVEVAGLPVADAARETLRLGRPVTREILLDPLLPEALVDTAARHAMIAAMVDYNRLGRRCWARFATEIA